MISGTPDAPPALLSCGSPTRFNLGSISVMSAIGMANGFAVFTVDGTGNVADWELAFDGSGNLDALVSNNVFDTNGNGEIGAASKAGTVLAASVYGRPAATGTAIYAFDSSFSTPAATSRRDGQIGAANPLANSGVDDGVAFLTLDQTTGEGDARLIDASGSDASSVIAVVPSSAKTTFEFMSPGHQGYAIAYTAENLSPAGAMIELLDASLNVVAGPVEMGNLADNAYHPEVAWAQQTNAYMMTWHQKASDGDDVWGEIVGPDLAVLMPATLLANQAANPTITTDGTGFWLTWQANNGTTTSRLAAAHVTVDGSVMPQMVSGSGGSEAQFMALDRDNQSVLLWTESGGMGPSLYFDPLCTP